MGVKGVIDVHHMHIWGLSTNENSITAHIQIEKCRKTARNKKGIKRRIGRTQHQTQHFRI